MPFPFFYYLLGGWGGVEGGLDYITERINPDLVVLS